MKQCLCMLLAFLLLFPGLVSAEEVHAEEGTWVCAFCGFECGSTFSFCPDCSHSRKESDTKRGKMTELWECAHCGQRNTSERFCTRCGHSKAEMLGLLAELQAAEDRAAQLESELENARSELREAKAESAELQAYVAELEAALGITGKENLNWEEAKQADFYAAKEPESGTEEKKALFRTVGNIVEFGHYPQTASGNDRTPIEWLVLDAQGSKVFLISRYGLDTTPYNESYSDVTWETCTLRTWLNCTFLNSAFSSEEQSAIILTSVDNSFSQGYSGWDTTGGNNTEDRIFLLSYAEANRYFGVASNSNNNTRSRVAPTEYAIEHKAFTSGNKTAEGDTAGYWWLRSPGDHQNHVAYVNSKGALGHYFVNVDRGAVRPAMWIDISGL